MSGRELTALGRFAAQLDPQQLPEAVIQKAKACLLYATAVGMASMRSKQAVQAACASNENKAGRATRFYDGRKAVPGDAAFANGTLFHARVQDDAHPAGHCGVVIIPAALAVAEATGANGDKLLAAIVAGYEIALRIGRDHAADASSRGFRTMPIYGVFGAAATAGHLLGLDEGRMTHALSFAASMAGGLREYSASGSEDFPFQAGTAACNGIVAARLAMAGATSATSALNGKAGFYRAYGNDERRYDARLLEALGEHFEVEAVTYKPYPICQFHRGIVRGSAALRQRAGEADFVSLIIRMHPFEADFYGVRFAGPFTTFPQSFMSAPFCAALAWLRGTATYAGLTDFAAVDVQRLLQRVTVIGDESRARYSPHLQVRMADGRCFEWEDREKAGAYLLTWQVASDMAHELATEAGISGNHADRLAAAVANLDQAPVSSVIDATRAACEAARSGTNY